MSWTTLGNGKCPPLPPEPFGFVHVSSGFDNHMALNSRGELFVWGSSTNSYTGQTPVAISGGFNPHSSHIDEDYLDYPVKVGTKSNWVTCDHINNFYLALDSEGYVWAWGDSYYGSCGWLDTSQYDIQTAGVHPRYVPGGSIALIPTRLEGYQWLAVKSGQYHTLLQSTDKSLWTLGLNDNASFGNTTIYPDGFKAYTPVEMTWVPGPVKLFSANTDVNAIVTESNEIWVWGDYSWTIGRILEPLQLPLSIPPGINVIDIKCEYNAVLVLLSNGDAYVRGNDVGLVGAPSYESTVFTKVPGDRFYVAIDVFDVSAGALDNEGNLWGWGPGRLFISRDDTFCDETSYTEPVFIASPTLGERKWKAFSIGLRSHIAISTDGRLFTWGSDIDGQLGAGSILEDFICSVVECGPIVYEDGTDATVAIATGIGPSIIRIPSPKQLAAHDPCGHWHKGGGSTALEERVFAANCWEPTISTDGIRVLYVIAGRHRPNELYMLQYDVATNVWTTVLEQHDILHSNWDGGAAISGEIYAFHNYAYDITGEQYNEVVSNPRMITYIGDNVKEWPGTDELHGRNKVAVTADGKVACIIRTGTSFFVQGSTNAGASYSLIYTLPVTTTDASVVISPNDGLVYVAAVEQSTDKLVVYSGNINGTGWSLKSTTTVVDAPTILRFHVDGTRFFAVVYNSLYYSTNNCTSFTRRDLHDPSIHFAATGTLFYNLSENQDWRTADYEATPVAWDEAKLGGTPMDRATLHNSGAITVYSQSTLRDEEAQGNIVTILLSRNLGTRWDEIKTPLHYYATFEETLNLNDNPVWPFVPQYAKF